MDNCFTYNGRWSNLEKVWAKEDPQFYTPKVIHSFHSNNVVSEEFLNDVELVMMSTGVTSGAVASVNKVVEP